MEGRFIASGARILALAGGRERVKGFLRFDNGIAYAALTSVCLAPARKRARPFDRLEQPPGEGIQ